jgi:molybdopterin-containing oxidoreductase family iron-sulfur binding subunit
MNRYNEDKSMGINRRKFLKIAGLAASASSLGIKGVVEASDGSSTSTDSSKKRWALVIDMRKCRGHDECNKCTLACHKTHNVPDIVNPKHEVKWIWKETFEHAFPSQNHEYVSSTVKESPILVLCNHCDNPPCVNVCPTQATFKRESDGLVMMDFHRCIGCRYCMVGCPYGARSFNWKEAKPFIKEINPKFPVRTKGVVEKCNLCAERIAKDQLPACVEVCEYKAIIFGDLHDPNSEIRQILNANDTIRRKPHLNTLPNVYYIM